MFLLAILTQAFASSSPAFLMIYSAYKLISRVTIYSLDVLLFLFGTCCSSLLFHVVNMELFMFKPVVNDFIEKYLVALIFHLIL